MGDNYYVLTPISYYFFANTILKCAAFQFFTPARKSTINFYLDVFKKRNKKVDMHHIYFLCPHQCCRSHCSTK